MAAREWIIGGLVAGGAWLWWREKGSQTKKTTHGPYAVVGDSLAVGLAPGLKGLLGDVTGWGVGGSIAHMWTMQIEAVLVGPGGINKPKTVIVSLGTNDAVSESARAAFPTRIKIIVDKIKAAGATPILLASPAKLPHIGETNAALGTTGALVLVPGLLQMQSDNVHPTAAGYKQWAIDIAEAIT